MRGMLDFKKINSMRGMLEILSLNKKMENGKLVINSNTSDHFITVSYFF